MFSTQRITRRTSQRSASVVAAVVAAVTFGASQASAEDLTGWWGYDGIQPSWRCGPSQQVFSNDYARACISVNGNYAQALVILNTNNHGSDQEITGNVQDDINGVDQAGMDRTCGAGDSVTPVGYMVCFAHTMTVPKGTDFGAWITLTDNASTFPDAHLYWSTYV